jgi:ATP-dependent Clp protease protease subunit
MKKNSVIELDIEEPSREVVLFGDIDKASVSEASKEILYINEYDMKMERNNSLYERLPINFHLCSEGGDVAAGGGMIGVIEFSKTPVHIYCYGAIMSIALNIAVSGHFVKAHRLCRFMYHETSLIGEINSTLTSMGTELKENLTLDELYDNHLIERTKLSKRKMNLTKRMKADWYFGAEDALKYGIVNEVF